MAHGQTQHGGAQPPAVNRSTFSASLVASVSTSVIWGQEELLYERVVVAMIRRVPGAGGPAHSRCSGSGQNESVVTPGGKWHQYGRDRGGGEL